MVTPEQQIAQQRQVIAQARARARRIAEKKTSKRELLQRTLKKGIQERVEQRKRKEVSEKELQKISKYEKEFEGQVKSYESQKKQYEKAMKEIRAIETIKKAASKGTVWIHAMYGSGIVKKFAKEYLKKQKAFGSVQVNIPGEPSVSAPPGYWNEKILEAHSKYQGQLSREDLRKSQYEQNILVQQMPGYQKELAEINALKETQESMVKFAESQGYARPQQYGKPYSSSKGLSKPIFDTSQIKDIQVGGYKQEIYDPRTGGYKTATYGIGAGGTAMERGTTYQEQIKIQEAQDKGSWQEFPVKKLLAGEYEFQKTKEEKDFDKLGKEMEDYISKLKKEGKISFSGDSFTEKATKKDIEKYEETYSKYQGQYNLLASEQKDVYGAGYTYKELAEKGAYPTIVRKATSDILGGGSIFLSEKITGTPISEPYKTQTKEQIGTLGLFFAFSPAMSTGTYSQQEISKQLSKGRFEKLKKLLEDSEDIIKSKKNLKEQTDFLIKIKKELKTDEQIKNFNKWVESLKERGILKPLEVDTSQLGTYSQKAPVTGEITIEVPKQLPVQEVGVVGIDVRNVRDVKWVGDSKQVKTEPSLSSNIFEELEKTEQQIKQEQQLKQKDILGLKEIQKGIQKPKQLELLKTEELAKQKQPQTAKEILKSLLILKQAQQPATKQIQKQPQQFKQAQKGKYPGATTLVPRLLEKVKKKKSSLDEEEEFKIFGKRYGKFFEVAEAKTKKGAKEKLVGWLKGGLGRSAYVQFKGMRLGFDDFGFDKEFRPSKKSKEIVVQRAKFSLGTIPERKAIQRARKGKKKIKWFS